MPENCMNIEVVTARPEKQDLKSLQMAPGSRVTDALQAAGFPHARDVGIFGRSVSMDHLLQDGDRIEIYRPLTINPKQARLRRAK